MKSLNSKHQVRIGREMQGFDGSPSFGSFSIMQLISSIKKLDLASKRVSTIARNGKAGFMDGSALEAQLSEPSGLIEVGNGVCGWLDKKTTVQYPSCLGYCFIFYLAYESWLSMH
ncbi:hypothetical protein ACS0TY_021997 [Phlomoides rotata]